MISWRDFRDRQPDLAGQGAKLLYHFGVGLAFLGTVRPDGGPRLHPMCPLLTDTGLYAFIVPSPSSETFTAMDAMRCTRSPLKTTRMLLPDRCASHVLHREIRDRLVRQFADERSDVALPPLGEEQHLFEFQVQAAMLTRTTGHGDPEPRHTIWRAV